MRGPGLKLDLDVRRLWTCPVCGKQRRLPGDVTNALCPCRDNGVAMQLTSDSRLLRRAERLTPLPYLKQPRSAPLSEEPASEETAPEEPTATEAAPPVAEQEPSDDFGSAIDLPPEPPGGSESV